jgi:hypothetical protein
MASQGARRRKICEIEEPSLLSALNIAHLMIRGLLRSNGRLYMQVFCSGLIIVADTSRHARVLDGLDRMFSGQQTSATRRLQNGLS